MYSLLVLLCVISVCSADVFNYKLYKDVLDRDKCSMQAQRMSHEFFDASFSTPGILQGHLASFGHYHQCLGINQHLPNTSIQGKYCLVRTPVTFPITRIPSLTGIPSNLTWTEITLNPLPVFSNISLLLAVCVPKACTVDAILGSYAKNPVNFNYSEEYCRLPNDKPFVAADYVAILIVSLVALLTIASTAYEVCHTLILRKDPKQASELYRACSLYTNTRRLLLLKKSRPIDCLDGIRSLSTLWIVLYHTYCTYFLYSNNVANGLEALEWKYKIQALWISSADIAVDSFFTMSGLLLVYTSFNKMTQTSFLRSLPWFYLSRFLRLFPLLAVAVLLQASLLHRVADGPGWHTMAGSVDRCRRYWWSALLHVQNIANMTNICLVPAWYLSVDMQLHVISSLVLYWVLGGRRAAWIALATGIIASLFTALAICIIYPSPISLMARGASKRNISNFTPYYYKNTLARSPPFFIGMLFGYALKGYREKKIKLPEWSTLTCHSLALVAFAYVVYIVHPSLQAEWDNQVADTMNNAFRRSGWSLALCWMIFACFHGHGGPVNWFLSLRLWKFFARLSYAIYLFHFMVQLTSASAGVAFAPIYFSMKTMFASFATDLVYTVAWAMVACVVVEEPLLTLQRIFLQGGFKSQQKQNENEVKAAPGAEDDENKDVEKLNIATI